MPFINNKDFILITLTLVSLLTLLAFNNKPKVLSKLDLKLVLIILTYKLMSYNY